MWFELFALLLTIGVEFAVYMAFVRREWRATLLNAVMINSLTQPLVTLVLTVGFSSSLRLWWTGFYLVEAIVIGVETPLIRVLFGCSWKRAFIMSLVANVVTASLSFVL